VRRVAWAILRDDADADDVSQEALARGLVDGPKEPRARSSWLATVARNAARTWRRGRGRAQTRDRATSRPEATVSVADATVRAETIRAVAEAVASLDEPMRSAVILRHYDGLAPREIAARSGESVDAVKKRLSRAHAALRARLEAQRPGGGSRWRDALGAFVVGASVSESGSAGTGGGILAMTVAAKGGIAVAAVGACALVGWLALRPDADEGAGGDVVADARPLQDSRPEGASEGPALAARGTAPATTADSPVADASSALAGAAAPGTGSPEVTIVEVQEQNGRMTPPDLVEVVVLGARDREGLSATLRSIDTSAPVEIPLSAPEADGVFRFRDVRRGRFEVVVRSQGGLERRWDVPQMVPQVPSGNYRQVVVMGEGSFAGRAFDRQGRPLPEHAVYVGMHDPLGAGAMAMTARTDGDGRFEVQGLRSGAYQLWVRLAEGDGRETFRPVERRLKPGERVVVDIGVPEAGRRVHGIVRLASGTPAGPPMGISFESPTGRSGLALAVGRLAQDGRFETLLDRGTYLAAIARNGTVERHEWTVTIGDEEVPLDVTLPGVRVSGTIEGRLPDARPRHSWMLVRMQVPESRDTFHWDAYVGEDLAFRFDGVPPGRYVLSGKANDPKVAFGEPIEVLVQQDRDVTGLTLRADRP
jgi:RNA polymerase sigma factor (sigma-70 family)